ncbi:MAG: DNA polymerase III subunit gamma/tau [Dictyoglomus sp.]|nr:DNA polymerase III subunit gamma/tau [Dictyoglomus sp.]MDW8188273.1 DNA polymerase III subunit gamma/tau [Dictyoglomus sp.]
MHLALYRKWRPKTFDEIVGQEHIVITLKNSIRFGRITHAYLFAGPRGTGKTTIARLLAKSLNCVNGPTENPCLKCNSCIEISEGNSLDVIEIDAASNRGIDEIRDIREKARLLPVRDRYKVYIIDEVHMLTTEAFNALLKILEEPPEHVIFILATTEPQRVPLTILSRCQRFDFRRLSREEIKEHLEKIAREEGGNITEGALKLVAIQSQGSMRDAISLLEQLLVFSSEEITEDLARHLLGLPTYEFVYEFAKSLGNYNLDEGWRLIQQVFQLGKNPQQFVRELLQHFRNLILIKIEPRLSNILSLTQEEYEEILEETKIFSVKRLQEIIDTLLDLENRLRDLTSAPLILEMFLLPLFIKPEAEKEVKEEVKEVGQEPLKEEIRVKSETSSKTPLSLDTIKERWSQVLERVKKRKVSLEAILREAKVLEISDDGRLVLGFPRNFTFLKERIEELPNRQLIEEEIKRVFNISLPLKFITIEEDIPIIKEEKIDIDPEEVKNIFNGKIIKEG